MEAAVQVFIEKGYRQFRLEDVAEKAGVTKPLIYHYFQGKDDLIRKTLDWRLDMFLSETREEFQQSKGAWDASLRRFTDRLREKWASPTWGRFHLVMGEMREENPELFVKWLERTLLGRTKIVAAILRRGVEDGHVRPDLDADAAGRFLIAGLWQVVHLHRHSGVEAFPPGDLYATFDTAVEVFVDGVAKRI